MRRSISLCPVLLLLTVVIYSCTGTEGGGNETSLGKEAKAESAVPIRPGLPGEQPFWNGYAKRFIYAPAFDYKTIENADQYLYKIYSAVDSTTYDFKSKVPYAALSPVWTKIPVGYFDLEVIGVSGDGDSIGLAGKGRYYHAAYFNGPYGHAVMPYDSSGIVALFHIMHKSYVSNWLKEKTPDSTYKYYRYPAKMFSALVSGAVTYARATHDTGEAARAVRIAEIVADYLLKISFPKGYAWEYMPPTYYGSWIAKLNQASWIKLDNLMPIYGTRAGDAYLDLYDYTHDDKYLQAAKRIAETFLKRQLENGTWYLYVNPQTGEPTSSVDNITIPVAMINYFIRLKEDYQVTGLDSAIGKAFSWIMENPVKTYNWHGQFEDVGTHKPYYDLSRRETCDLAVYLFKEYPDDSNYVKIAKDLVRFSEDQFVVWEKPRPLNSKRHSTIGNSANWILPSAHEQYTYWMPTGPAAMEMVDACWWAYKATGEELYLAKAKSLANTMTMVQKYHNGEYSTYFTKYTAGEWLNCNVESAVIMINFGENLKSLK